MIEEHGCGETTAQGAHSVSLPVSEQKAHTKTRCHLCATLKCHCVIQLTVFGVQVCTATASKTQDGCGTLDSCCLPCSVPRPPRPLLGHRQEAVLPWRATVPFPTHPGKGAWLPVVCGERVWRRYTHKLSSGIDDSVDPSLSGEGAQLEIRPTGPEGQRLWGLTTGPGGQRMLTVQDLFGWIMGCLPLRSEPL